MDLNYPVFNVCAVLHAEEVCNGWTTEPKMAEGKSDRKEHYYNMTTSINPRKYVKYKYRFHFHP
jgi:hypothetical protein